MDKAQRQITAIAVSQVVLPQLGLVDMIILPVRMAGAWILYMTQRSIKQQGSYRIAANFRRVGREDRDVPYAAFNLDQVMHTLGRNAMALWLKLFLKHGASEGGPLHEYSRNKAEMAISQDYVIVGEQPLIASAMTPGTMAMYLLHGALTSAKRQMGDIIAAHDKIDAAQATGYDMAQQCRQKMQLVFAANSHAGVFPGDYVSSEATEDSAERFRRVDRRNRGPQGRALRAQQWRDNMEVRGLQPARGENQRGNRRDNQRENPRDDNRDRKRDRKYDYRRSRK